MVPGNATPVKDTEASASNDRWGTIPVNVTVSFAGQDGDIASAIAALGTTVFTVTVTPGTNVKVSFEDEDAAFAATGNATFTFDKDDLSVSGNNYVLTTAETLYIAVNGGTDSANSGVTARATDLSISAQVSGGSIQ